MNEKIWLKLYRPTEKYIDKFMYALCSKIVRDFKTKPSTTYAISIFNDDKIICAEVGVHHGINAKNILQNLNVEKMFLIDCWDSESDALNITRNRLNKFKTKLNYIKGYSVEEGSKFTDNFFDFVYIDTVHTYDMMRDDLMCWYPKIKKGGILSGHGFSGMYGVPLALDDYCLKNGLCYDGFMHDWWIVK